MSLPRQGGPQGLTWIGICFDVKDVELFFSQKMSQPALALCIAVPRALYVSDVKAAEEFFKSVES